METNKAGKWLEAIVISGYKTMWLAHGSQVTDHMMKNKEGIEAHLPGGVLYAQACSE